MMKNTLFSSDGLKYVMAASLLCQASVCLAEWPLVGSDNTSLSAGLDTAFGVFATESANFGTGRIDLRNGDYSSEARWQEAYAKPYLDFEHITVESGTLYSGASAVAAWTGGDGDVSGYTNSHDQEISTETLFLGWRSGDLLASSLGDDAVDLSYGRQDVQLGDGFLIWDGNLDQFDKAAYWLGPRTAFERAGLIRMNTQPIRADLFHLESDSDQDHTDLAGINLEYVNEEFGTVGAMYFHVLDTDTPNLFGPRDGMNVWSLSASGLTLPAIPAASLWTQYVKQTGDGPDASFDADAWFVELQYSLESLPWSPTLSYRYASFSGDPDANDNKRQDFEPFFYGWSRGWGTWIQGEITGEYLLFNSNQKNHMLHLAASPNENLGVGLILYRFDLDQPDYYGTSVSDKHFTDELNLYVDWSLNDKVSISAAYALANPGTAAKQVFGDNERFQLVEMALYVSF